MAFLLIGFLLAGGLLLLLNWWAAAEVKSAKRMLFWSVIGLSIVLGLILFARGGFVTAFVPTAFAVWRMTGAANQAAKMAGKMGHGPYAPKNGGQMNREEALEILGLEAGASDAEINTAYKRLISQCHPDKGGSDWMAAKLNAAKQALTQK
jgi:DnaJ domain